MGDKDIIEVPFDPINKDLHGKDFSAIPFDLGKFSRKQIVFSTSQVDGVKSPLRSVSQKHEDKLMEV